MRPRGLQIGTPPPAPTQVAPSSVKICIALREADCFCALWNEIPCQLLNVFEACKEHLCSADNTRTCSVRTQVLSRACTVPVFPGTGWLCALNVRCDIRDAFVGSD